MRLAVVLEETFEACPHSTNSLLYDEVEIEREARTFVEQA